MKIERILKIVPVVLAWLVGFLGRADGQEERLALNPPLGQIFPLDPEPDGIRIKYPVLLNDRTILRPNVVLRFIYVDPNAGLHSRGGGYGGGPGEGGGAGVHGHRHGDSSADSGDGGSAYTRDSSSQTGDGSEAQDSSGAGKAHAKELGSEVWTRADLFRDALDDAPDMGTTLVFSFPDKPKPQTATIDLPDGMLLAEIGNHVQVLGLTADSRAFQSGLQPGDEIRSFQGHLAIASLKDFLRVYFAVRGEARKGGQSYSIEVWRPNDSRLVTVQVAPPPSLPSLF